MSSITACPGSMPCWLPLSMIDLAREGVAALVEDLGERRRCAAGARAPRASAAAARSRRAATSSVSRSLAACRSFALSCVVLPLERDLRGEEFGGGPEQLGRRERHALQRIGEQGDGLADRLGVAEARVEHHEQHGERHEEAQADQRRGTAAEKRRRLVAP